MTLRAVHPKRPKEGGDGMGRDMSTRTKYERTAELASTPSSVTVARHLVRDDLGDHGVDRLVIEDALLVVTELMGNAVRHARPLPTGESRGRVRLHWGVFDHGRVQVDVTDGGGDHLPRVGPQSLVESRGRGLAIVSAVAEDWGVAADDGQVTVYAVVGQ
jgi:serine/threonine-protein kinase RsbW